MNLCTSLVSDTLELIVEVILVAVVMNQSFELIFIVTCSFGLFLDCQIRVSALVLFHAIQKLIYSIKHNLLVPKLDRLELIIGLHTLMETLDKYYEYNHKKQDLVVPL